MISIIVPVYNSSNYIDNCIKSILNQTYNNWELILVDDGSIDDSYKKCLKYVNSDKRISIYLKSNEGAGFARNLGMFMANGEYIMFVDSDDELDKDALNKCNNKIKETKADLIVFGMKTKVCDENENIKYEVQDMVPNIAALEANEFRNSFKELSQYADLCSPCNKVYKKEIINSNNILFPNLRRMQDGVFNLFYFDKTNIISFMSDNIYIRRWHSNSFQKKKMPKYFIDCAIEYQKTLISMLEKWNINNIDNKLYFSNVFSEIVMTAEFDYFNEKESFRNAYNHIKSINSKEYVSSFFNDLASIRKLSKKELCIKKRLNIVLTLYLLIQLRRGKYV